MRQQEETMYSQAMREIEELEGNPETGGKPILERFLDRCTSCGDCTSACRLLKIFGSPVAIISRRDQNVFLCTNCGACSSLCASGLDPAEALLQAKHLLLSTGQVSQGVLNTFRSAHRFVQWGHKFPFAYYTTAETVFWPGCSLAAMSPEVVRKTSRRLGNSLGKKVGIALDCCSGPSYHIGDLDEVNDTALHIKGMFEMHGVTSIIAACMNCVRILRRALPGVRVDHVLEVLPAPAASSLAGKECYLHHPCPARHFDAVAGNAKRLVEQLGARVIEQAAPRCCGFGGNMHALSPEQANERTNEIIAASGKAPIVTYCSACKDRFLSKGKRTYHLLEVLVSAKPVERSVSSAQKWFNRFLLATGNRLMTAFSPGHGIKKARLRRSSVS